MRQPSNVVIFDRDMHKLAYLENAHNISYEMSFNSLWMASFSLPANDEKNEECKSLNFVELYDENEYIGLFRILPNDTKRSSDGARITYQCEHVLATLLDDVLFQYHTVGNLGYFTSNVIQYVLSKQTVGRWQLGVCEFDRQFEYNWENDNLLGALFSIPKPFIDEYMWTWDTTSYPWTLNLIKPSNNIDAHIRYGVNMTGLERYIDPTNLCTRIYPLGYGEGVNQLNIADVNGGLPHLDSDTQDQFGVISKVWVDRRIESAESLKARAEALLNEMKLPRTSYKVSAAELYKITKDKVDKFKLGTLVKVKDDELGIEFTSRVVKYSKGDVIMQNGNVTLEIANKTQDIASSLADLQSRQKINETHAQGATNVNVYNLAENCDPTHPAKFKIWIPDEAVRINKVLLSYNNEPFRANSKAIQGGGAMTLSSESDDRYDSQLHFTGENVGNVATDSAGGHYHMVSGNTTDYDGDHIHWIDEHVHYQTLIPHYHEIELPNHIHAIQFGIYEGPTASSNGLFVDGNLVPGSDTSAIELDLTGYLEVDGEGKIQRGQFHEIEIVPNSLSRIVATVVVQFFVQSRGGGSY